MSILSDLRQAWCDYNKIQAEWDYCLEEGGETDLTRQDVHMAWEKINTLITSLPLSEKEQQRCEKCMFYYDGNRSDATCYDCKEMADDAFVPKETE